LGCSAEHALPLHLAYPCTNKLTIKACTVKKKTKRKNVKTTAAKFSDGFC